MHYISKSGDSLWLQKSLICELHSQSSHQRKSRGADETPTPYLYFPKVNRQYQTHEQK